MSLLQRLRFQRGTLPVLLQAETAECGLACIAMVAAYHGYRTDLPALRRRFSLSLKGTNLRALMDMCERLNLAARPVRCELEELSQLQLPAILHWDLNHFVVLKSVGRRGVVLHNPAAGERRYPLGEVSRRFTGIALELSPTELFTEQHDARRMRLSDFWQRATELTRSIAHVLALSVLLQVFALASPFYVQRAGAAEAESLPPEPKPEVTRVTLV